MRFRFFGTEIYISFLFVAVVAFIIATDRTGLSIPTMFSILLHEAGHLIAMWICDCEPKSIRLVPASVSITRGIGKKKHSDMFIALSGPISNALMAISLYINFFFTKNAFSFDCATINLALFSFNMLPVCGLDGGTALKIILNWKFGDVYKADRVVRIVTMIIGLFVLVLGVTVIINGNKNITVLIVGLYILISAFMKF